ncbi:MAG: UbiA family prenyltransferase, partial [Phycisphaerales bacterium]
MRPVAARILDAFQLTRLSLAFGAVCELWLVTLLTRADPRYVHLPVYHMPLWKALFATGLVAIGLFAFAASLNDLLDIRHDRQFSPERPLAAGRIRTSSAAMVSFASLMMAVVAASVLGEAALVLTVAVAAAILFYRRDRQAHPVGGHRHHRPRPRGEHVHPELDHDLHAAGVVVDVARGGDRGERAPHRGQT